MTSSFTTSEGGLVYDYDLAPMPEFVPEWLREGSQVEIWEAGHILRGFRGGYLRWVIGEGEIALDDTFTLQQLRDIVVMMEAALVAAHGMPDAQV